MLTGPVAAGGLAFLVAGALVPLLVKFAVGRSLLDVPNIRSSHEVPTPRLGGVAIFAGALVGVAVLGPEGALPLLVAAAVIWAVGLWDDLSNLNFKTKAAAQALAATGLILFYPPPVLSEAPALLWPVVVFVGVFWIVALTNAFNFMDGIDGFTGGVAIVNAFFLIPLSGETGAFLPALIGATAGFLVWNISPASMFIGDSGAYFLGFSLAATALYAPVIPNGTWTPLGFLAGVHVFLPYLFDTAFTILRRLVSGAGKSIFLAHREHIYQRITPTADLHRRTSNLYYAASAVAGLAALLVAQGGVGLLLGLGVAAVLCAALAVLPKVV
jgi:UDP-GlcNAc:undecaprenyl-phosphate GlcNAc-1-phosphate transferase